MARKINYNAWQQQQHFHKHKHTYTYTYIYTQMHATRTKVHMLITGERKRRVVAAVGIVPATGYDEVISADMHNNVNC